MVKKQLLLITIIFLFASITSTITLGQASLPLCLDPADIRINCTMVTPSLTCDNFTYRILNVTGELIVPESSLTLLNESIYFFNFTERTGEYIVELCDGTTREVRVAQDDVTYETGLALMILGIIGFGGFGTYIIISNVTVQNKLILFLITGVKFLFILMVPWLLVLGIALFTQVAIDQGADASIVSLMNTFYRIFFLMSLFVSFVTFVVGGILFFQWLTIVPKEYKSVFGNNKRRGF